MAGDFTQHDGKWFVTVPMPDGTERTHGGFDTREKAAEHYKAQIALLYPVPAAVSIDPNKHHSLSAADIVTKPFNAG